MTRIERDEVVWAQKPRVITYTAAGEGTWLVDVDGECYGTISRCTVKRPRSTMQAWEGYDDSGKRHTARARRDLMSALAMYRHSPYDATGRRTRFCFSAND
jgi:hypothetical protein